MKTKQPMTAECNVYREEKTDIKEFGKDSIFPLLPYLRIKQANYYETKSFCFKWLFFKIWTLDNFQFEFSFVLDYHWGIGFAGILPYLRWVVAIPIPIKLKEHFDKLTARKTEFRKEAGF
jgi:hypothetical protein